jgi:hypothetical protein
MRRLRVFLFLLLAIAVPLQGYAHFAQPLIPCPMEHPAMMAMADAAAAHDCCDDAEPAEQTGKACKSGQPCQSGGQHFSVATFGVLPQVPVPATRFPRIAADMSSFDPAAAWRPPAQF